MRILYKKQSTSPYDKIQKYTQITPSKYWMKEKLQKTLAFVSLLCYNTPREKNERKRRIKNMKKIICKREYDTENATLVKKVTFGNFGDAEGYEESLYQTEKGLYFLYVNGGEASPYKAENIKAVSKAKAEEWLAAH